MSEIIKRFAIMRQLLCRLNVIVVILWATIIAPQVCIYVSSVINDIVISQQLDTRHFWFCSHTDRAWHSWRHILLLLLRWKEKHEFFMVSSCLSGITRFAFRYSCSLYESHSYGHAECLFCRKAQFSYKVCSRPSLVIKFICW